MVRFVFAVLGIIFTTLFYACDLNGITKSKPTGPTDTIDTLKPPCIEDTLMVCGCPMPKGMFFRVVHPNGAEQLKVGDLVRVNFCVNPDVGGEGPKYFAETVAMSVSVDGGKSWGQIYPLSFGDPHSRLWTVPETLLIGENEVSSVSNNCLFRVQVYGDLGNPDSDLDVSDAPFSSSAPQALWCTMEGRRASLFTKTGDLTRWRCPARHSRGLHDGRNRHARHLFTHFSHLFLRGCEIMFRLFVALCIFRLLYP